MNQEINKCALSLEELFEAYYECRKHKRKTLNALDFELNFEQNLIALWRDINDHSYQVGRSIAFIVRQPVKREIFAADFRDRVVHHLIIRKLISFFEAAFSNDSYSCRKGKGTLYAINQVCHHIRACSQNYTRPCYVMKLDIEGFFMNIRPDILHHKLIDFVNAVYHEKDKDLLLELIEKVVLNRPEKNCLIKGGVQDWDGLPPTKSLFHSKGKGLPIGNLTSQIFANFYLNEFDQYIGSLHSDLYYGRYVDDLVFIHPDKDFLLQLKETVTVYLKHHLGLTIHPKKMYLQLYQKGVAFVGGYLLPDRVYASRRLKRNFFGRIHRFNRESVYRGHRHSLLHVTGMFNSYFGLVKYFKTYKLRRKAIGLLNMSFKHCVSYDSSFLKLTPYKKYRPAEKARQKVLKNRQLIRVQQDK